MPGPPTPTGAISPTGPASYHLKTVSAGRIEAEINTPAREGPAWIRLHLFHPEGRALRSTTSNGAAARVLSAAALEIPDPSGKLKIVAEF